MASDLQIIYSDRNIRLWRIDLEYWGLSSIGTKNWVKDTKSLKSHFRSGFTQRTQSASNLDEYVDCRDLELLLTGLDGFFVDRDLYLEVETKQRSTLAAIRSEDITIKAGEPNLRFWFGLGLNDLF